MNADLPASWPALVAVLGALVLAAGVVAGLGRLGVARQVVTASLRAAAQLGAVSVIIVAVLRSAGFTAVFVLVMYLIASLTAARRMTRHRSGGWAGLAIAAGVAPVLGILIGTGLVAARPVAVLPVAGILIGGAMTATGLGGRRALDDLAQRAGEYEARLALGFPGRTARRDVVRPAAAQALLPAIDQTRTVGLVTLPGAFVGVLLGGASPVQAGVTQLLVLIGLLAIETVAVLVVVELVAAGLIRPGTGPDRRDRDRQRADRQRADRQSADHQGAVRPGPAARTAGGGAPAGGGGGHRWRPRAGFRADRRRRAGRRLP